MGKDTEGIGTSVAFEGDADTDVIVLGVGTSGEDLSLQLLDAGLDDVDYWTTRDVIQMDELPESMIVLGGGASGAELGQVLARFGVNVTLVEAKEPLLSREEPEASEVLEDAFAAEGIDVHTGARAERVESRDGSFVVTLAGGAEVTGERLFVATGRTVDLSDLGLESAGVDATGPYVPTLQRSHAKKGVCRPRGR